MPDISELILAIVKPLVAHPEDITLDISESRDFVEYSLHVHPDDIGCVIGKQGRVARAIRTIVYSVRTKGPKRVRVNIENNAA